METWFNRVPRGWRHWLAIFRVCYIEVLWHLYYCNFSWAETEVLFVISRTSLYRGSLNQGSTVPLTYYFLLNPLIPKSDQNPTSPNNIIPQSHIRSWESRKWSPTGEAPNYQTNSPRQHLCKCVSTVWRVCIPMLECRGLMLNEHNTAYSTTMSTFIQKVHC